MQKLGTDPENELFAIEAEARSNSYKFLSGIYLQPPTLELIEQLNNSEIMSEFLSLLSSDYVKDFKEYVELKNNQSYMAQLKQEFMNLFVVPTGSYVVPFEDIYRGMRNDGEQEFGPLMGERAVAVTRIYREAGAELEKTCKELPTHVGVELSFMNYLCAREAEIIREEKSENQAGERTNSNNEIGSEYGIIMVEIYQDYQFRFLKNHLTTWFPQLCQTIQEKSSLPFYKGMALITKAFIQQDFDYLANRYNHAKPSSDYKLSSRPNNQAMDSTIS